MPLLLVLCGTLSIPSAQAATAAWYRGDTDINGTTLIDTAAGADAIGGPGETLNDVAGPYIYDPVSKKYYDNDAAYQGQAKSIPNTLNSVFQNNFTVEGIVKMSGSPDASLVFFNQYDPPAGFGLGLNSWNYSSSPQTAEQIVYGFSVDAPTELQRVVTGFIQPYEEYYSLAITGVRSKNGDMLVTLYLNGSYIGETSYSGGIYLTEANFAVSGAWRGLVDELRISDVALTPEQFLQFATSKKP